MKKRTIKGLALMEILVTLFVISFGLLGVVKMQAIAKRYSLDAVQRTLAALYTDNIIERMRANRNNDLTEYHDKKAGDTTFIIPSTKICTQTANCSAAEHAAVDIYNWHLLMLGVSEQHPDDTGFYSSENRAGSGGLINPLGCTTVTSETRGGNVVGFNVTVVITWRGMKQSGHNTQTQINQAHTTADLDDKIADCGGTDVYRRQFATSTFIAKQL